MNNKLLPIIFGAFLIAIGIILLNSDWFNGILQTLYSTLRGGSLDSSVIVRLGYNSLWYGSLALFFSILIVTRLQNVFSRILNEKFLLIFAALLVIISYMYFMITCKSATIDGERFWWLIDDEMISMRYARNFISGLGLVWNPGERVEGYSNFLWTIYMSVVHLFVKASSKTSLIILLTNITLIACTIPVIIRLCHLFKSNSFVIYGSVLGFVLNINVMGCCLDGFEAVLLSFLFMLSVYRTIKESQDDQVNLITYLIIGAISLVRADAVVLSALLYALSFLLNKNRRTVFLYIGLSLLIPLAHFIFRIIYYGDILPSTAYLKTMNWSGKYIVGLKYVLSFLSHYGLLVVLVVIGTALSRRKDIILLIIGFFLYSIYIAYIGGDAFIDYRFFMPFIPLLMILGFQGIQHLTSGRSAGVIIVSILLLMSLPVHTPYTFAQDRQPEKCNIENIKLGLLIKNNTPEDCTVADFWAGSVFYFSERYGIDFLGKVDPHIAKLPVVSDGTLPGHNKFDFDYSLGIFKPDLVIANFSLPVSEEKMKQLSTGNPAFTGRLYFNRIFQEHYFENPVNIKTWRTIFIRDESPLCSLRTLR
ncbi:MAG: hypothetical protein P9X24_05040 [Candidatus Hatepunaea meridiana]|nr:hypothetical protein [Candidatus Hatepunaea meridiana]